MNTLQRQARLFHLLRPTAAHLTRMLAEGVEWSDGAVALRWHGRRPNTSAWDSLEALLAVHATDTQFRWLCPTPPVQPAVPPTTTITPVWLPAPDSDGLCSRCADPWPCLRCGP